MIAAHARSLGFTLVTDNTRDFAGIPGLSLDNWRETGIWVSNDAERQSVRIGISDVP